MKDPEKVAQGKRNRRIGAEFEKSTRNLLEMKGWIVDKWTNNVDLQTNEIIQAKSNRFMSRTTGFPDFIALKKEGEDYEVMLVEAKSNNRLDVKEKKKLNVYLDLGFRCFVSFKGENKVELREVERYEARSMASGSSSA